VADEAPPEKVLAFKLTPLTIYRDIFVQALVVLVVHVWRKYYRQAKRFIIGFGFTCTSARVNDFETPQSII